MPYLPGGTLKQRLGRPIPWKEAVRLLLSIARALQYAHDQENIIHRDVKPSNILITRSGEPMLTDFGIAKILTGEHGQTLTEMGAGIGTPEYMAPEQWVGKATVQSDVYSLGVVLYEMVTGHAPYTADTPTAVLLKQAKEPLPRPGQFLPGLPEMVEKALCKALEKQPEDRYPTMGDFAAALNGLMSSSWVESDQTIAAKRPRMDGSSQPRQDERKQDRQVIHTEGGTLISPARTDAASAKPEKPSKRFSRLAWIIGIFIMGVGVVAIISSRLFHPSPSPLPKSTLPKISYTQDISFSNDQMLLAPTSPPTETATFTVAYTPTWTLTASPVSGFFPSDAPIKLAYIYGGVLESQNADVYVANEDGNGNVCVACGHLYEGDPSLSGDGEWVVYHAVNSGGTTDIYKVPSSGGSAINLTSTPSESEREPAFSHDGSQIAYQFGSGNARSENGEIYIINSSGGSKHSIGQKGHGPAWSPDDRNLAFMQFGSDKTWQIVVYSFATGKSQKITSLSDNARWPCWSPDGQYIAFNSTDKYMNPDAIWIIPADGSDSPRMVTRGNAGRPSWSTNGLISYNITDTGIAVIKPDGSGERLLIQEKDAYASSWSR
jgi:serine/threonine protein kinase